MPENKAKTPKWANRFLEWYCSPELLDEVQGDLYEAFHRRVKRYGVRKARRLFIKEVLLFCRPSSFQSPYGSSNPINVHSLFWNYFKIAWRNILKAKAFSLINMAGLALGLAACLLILQFVNFERSYDRFHKNTADIYRVKLDRLYPDRRDESAGCTAFLGPALKQAFPEVQAYTKLWGTKHLSNILTYEGHNYLEQQLYYADESFFEVFSYDLVAGDKESALTEPFSMVLTETVARKIFGDASAIGQTIEYAGGWGRQVYTVTGIAADNPANTHLQFNCLISFKTLVGHTNEDAHTSTGWNAFLTYLLLKPGSDASALEAKFPSFVSEAYASLLEEGVGVELFLQPLADIHLKSNIRFEAGTNGDQKIVRILLFAALFILGIAWVNYVNLTTAKSMERAREVGVRKVIGADKRDLRRQFILEAILLNLMSLLLAIGIAAIVMPFLNKMIGTSIAPFALLSNPQLLLTMAIVFAVGIFSSGFYPAFVISSFSPAHALSGATLKMKGVLIRKALVVFQFGVSIVLIAGSFIVFQQLGYMLNKDIGMDTQQTLVVKGPGIYDSTYEARLISFKERLGNHPAITKVTNSTAIPGKEVTWVNNSVRWTKQPEMNTLSMPFIGVDYDFFSAFDLPLVSGRTFDLNHQTDGDKLVLTKAAAKVLGFQNPEAALDEEITDGGQTYQVVGIVEDYHQEALNADYRPIIFRYIKHARSYYSLQLASGDAEQSIAFVKAEWQRSFPGNPFSYFFLDEFFDRQYQADQLFGQLFSLFTILGIVVACLGLLGLSSYSIRRRTKEIGIRKILGANIRQILMLISREYLALIALAALLGTPVAYWLTSQWLANYAFAIELQWWYFALPFVVLVLITVITIGFHALKAAIANPVQALRYE